MNSEKVLSFFREIVCIPRESGHEEQIIAYLQKFAKDRDLECHTDKVGNVMIVKPATKGAESRPTIILQSHSDMVCEKNSGVEHDFSKDPIKYVIEDGWMIAKDTTLGADCGIGIAAELALLEDEELSHGRIEALFTVSEETGLDGAKALQPGFMTGKILLNLDSEDEGELFVGCAGGLDTTALFKYDEVECKNKSFYKIRVFGAMGGHSGDDIDKGRANSVQQLGRILYDLKPCHFELCEINGGNKRNAIAREAYAVLAINSADIATAQAIIKETSNAIKAEYATTDSNVDVSMEPVAWTGKAICQKVTNNLINALITAPHGVLAMSADLKGLVETSSNLASVKMDGSEHVIRIGSSQRSAINSARKFAGDRFATVFEMAGAEVRHENEYPGWKPNMDSPIKDVTVNAYKKLFGVDPIVRAIHAGLECGLFLENYPDLDMISFGPTLRGVHAPGERLELASLDKFVALLEEVIKMA